MTNGWWTDLRDAWRGLRRVPAVALSAVFCLALGLGVTTAISSAVDRALLQRLPFRDADRLVTIYRTTPQFNTGPFSAPNFLDLARDSRQLGALAAATPTSLLLSMPDGGVQTQSLRVTGNLFSMLGVPAVQGRLLTPEDDAEGAPPAVVLGEEYWRDRFAGDAALVGRIIRLDGLERTVVGIAPRGFRIPHGARLLRADVWVPMQFTGGERSSRRNNFIMVLGRLAPGATVESATADLETLFSGLTRTYPQLRGEGVRVLPLRTEGARVVRGPLLLLFGAVCFVLLIAATNVASLLLARGVQRRREMAIRAALGGGRWAVMRPVLAESLLLAGLGMVLGVGLAWAGVRTIGTMAARHVPQVAGLGIDLRLLSFALLLSLLVAVVCGAVPAWRSASVDPQAALSGGRGGGPGRAHHRALGLLVVFEVALSLVLLIGAGLVLRGFAGLISRDPGFDTDRVLTLEATVAPDLYPDGTAVTRFLEPALAAVQSLPGVEGAAAISVLPYRNWGWNFNIRYEGQTAEDPTQRPLVENRLITPGFFQATGQRLVAGRALRESDAAPDAPAVVVANEALVRRDFPGQDPIGRRFHTGDTTFATIVGVVSDIRNFGPVEDPRPEIYWSLARGGGFTSFPIMVRMARGDPGAQARPVLAAIQGVDRTAAVTRVQSMNEVIAESVGRPRFYLLLLSVFALVAIVLSVAGLYGVMSYSVAQRTRELGIRAALGSSTTQTLRLVARQGALLVGVGVLAGLVGGAALTRLLQGLLYGVSPLDPVTWLLASGALLLAGVVAALVPAGRASRVSPMVAIQAE